MLVVPGRFRVGRETLDSVREGPLEPRCSTTRGLDNAIGSKYFANPVMLKISWSVTWQAYMTISLACMSGHFDAPRPPACMVQQHCSHSGIEPRRASPTACKQITPRAMTAEQMADNTGHKTERPRLQHHPGRDLPDLSGWPRVACLWR